jgi:energy-coupling factor transport system ATP-binding protein
MVPIQIENLSFTYPSRETPTLHGINAEIFPSDFVLLTGPTGCGKTTLLRTMNGLIPHASSGTLTGAVRVNDENVASQPLASTCQQVALLFQNPEDQLFCTLVQDEIAFGLENLGFPSEKIKERITLALEQVGLTGFEDRRIAELSGGEKQRVALASICAMQPQVLLLDEPTSHLDPRATHDILNIVKQLNTEIGITVVLATHRVKEVTPFCNRVWLMHEGKLCLDLPKTEAFQDTSVFQSLGVEVPETETSPRPVHRKPPSNITLHRPLLNVKDISFCYPNSEKNAVQTFSCKVSRGEIIAIMGANGSGKTTLLHLMGGLLQPSFGQVIIDGKMSKRRKLHQLAGKVGIVFQNPDLLLQAETVEGEVAFGPKNLKLKSDILQTVVDTLAQFKLEDFAEEAPYSLSRGQRQRIAVAATFSLHPDIFLLDEPTTGQDAQHLQHLMDELCDQIRQENKTLIFATHNTELTLKYADRVFVLSEGELIFDGTPNAAFSDAELLKNASLAF